MNINSELEKPDKKATDWNIPLYYTQKQGRLMSGGRGQRRGCPLRVLAGREEQGAREPGCLWMQLLISWVHMHESASHMWTQVHVYTPAPLWNPSSASVSWGQGRQTIPRCGGGKDASPGAALALPLCRASPFHADMLSS